MKFSEKLKKLRSDNNITQDELANKIFVTRTAISKWETGAGYPSLESLKLLSRVFGVTLDELVSDEDIKNKKLLNEKKSKQFYWVGFGFWAVAMLSAILQFSLKIKWFFIPMCIGAMAYLVFATLSKIYFNKHGEKSKIKNILIRHGIIFLIFIAISIYSIISLF